MISIRFAVNFLFDFYEKVFLKKLSKFQSDEKVKEYDHQIRHKKLSMKSLKNQLSTFLGEKIHCSKLFRVFLKTNFSGKAPNCTTYNVALTSSDRAEIFTTYTLKYPPEVESAVLISDALIQIWRVLKARKPVFQRTFRNLKKERK
jgi:hypothetical protein